MSNRLPEHPESLRTKARTHRMAAATETDPRRRRAYIFIASEYETLADAIEWESKAAARRTSGWSGVPDPSALSGGGSEH